MAISKGKTRVQISFANFDLDKIDKICNETGMSRTDYVTMLVHLDMDKRSREGKEMEIVNAL
jgi:predicted DNA binding CopG/RHH family protein